MDTIHLSHSGSSLESGGLRRRSVRLSVGVALGLGVLLAALFLLSASGSQSRAGLAPTAVDDAASQSAAARRWLSETVDNSGDVGYYTSLALEPVAPYTPHISYYDQTDGVLRHAWWTSSGWLSETVDDGGAIGTSLALEPVAPYTPHISYYDFGSTALKHAWWTPSGWLSETVDSSGSVGYFSSLALEPVAPYTPHISYCDYANTALKYAWWTPSGWLSETVDNSGDMGLHTSLALEPAAPYVPHISYTDMDNRVLRYAWWTPSGWMSETVDNVGWYSSLALEPLAPYTPHIGYHDETHGAYKHAWWTSSGWLSETVDDGGAIGTSLALEPVAPYAPHLSYLDSTGLKHGWWTPSGWLSETVDNSGNVGGFSSLALEPVAPYAPRISYRDITNNSLKHAWLLRRVLFDEAHGERNTLDWARAQQIEPGHPEWVYFGRLVTALAPQFQFERNASARLTPALLANYDILVLSAPTEPFDAGEIAAIQQFVDLGGGLIVLGDCGLDHPANAFMPEYEISFDPHCIFGPIPDLEGDFSVAYFASHPAVAGGSSFVTNWGQSLQFGSGATYLAWTDTDIWQDSNWNDTYDAGIDLVGPFTIIAGKDTGYGRVAAISDNSFQDDGFEWRGNAPLMRTLLYWVAPRDKRVPAFVHLPLVLRDVP
jgi:hypothetical protein